VGVVKNIFLSKAVPLAQLYTTISPTGTKYNQVNGGALHTFASDTSPTHISLWILVKKWHKLHDGQCL